MFIMRSSLLDMTVSLRSKDAYAICPCLEILKAVLMYVLDIKRGADVGGIPLLIALTARILQFGQSILLPVKLTDRARV